MTLPTCLAPFTAYRQFITFALRDSTTRPGKVDKLPTDWRTGQVANAHDPAIWTDYDTAFQHGGKVGFVFTDGDPFWFLDIDDCLLPSGWSPLAQEICGLLSGCAVEISLSGRGLHLFGVGQIPPHSTRAPGLELYHTGRFVALGGRAGATGNALADCTAGLAEVVRRYFSEVAPGPSAQWTAAPCAEWRGSVDDADLIRRACNSRSIAGAFGARATFQQLWDGDVAALRAAYPAEGRDYDASSADAALAQHLAFWTGRDCERMRRLMLQSKLARDKWNRDDYLPRTILQAVGKSKDVCQDKVPAAAPGPELVAAPQPKEGDEFLHPEAQMILFAGCTYVAHDGKILLPGGHLYNSERFDVMLGGFQFIMNRTSGKTTTSAWEAFTKNRSITFPRAHFASFRPDLPVSAIWDDGNHRFVNSYYPIATPSKRGNAAPFLNHLAKILPDEGDRSIMLAYMAAVVQHPGVKFQWCPLLQGAPGNGKSLLSRCLVNAVGQQYCHSPKANEIAEKFNDWIVGKIFIGVEDVYFPKEKIEILEILKPMITEDRLEIRGMGLNKITSRICANFMLNSNHRNALTKSKDDRRLAIFYCPQQTYSDIERDEMAGDYFPRLYAWLKDDGYAVVTDYLSTYPIPSALNPATDCHRAPTTTSTPEAVIESAGKLEQEIIESIECEQVGFRGGWISSHYLDALVRANGLERQYARNVRRRILQEMGYDYHPSLYRGQVNVPVQPDGVKSRLFIKSGHACTTLKSGQAALAYTEAQTASSMLRAVA